MPDTQLFLSLAEIAGVFVGFGALIAVRSGATMDANEINGVRWVVATAIWVIIAALTPTLVRSYGVSGHELVQARHRTRPCEDGPGSAGPPLMRGSDSGSDIAPDGSPVAFYRRLPASGEPELIHGVIPARASILDLGCGPGRIAGPLVALGHAVTGVDDGAGMIAALPPGVEGVVADARSVRLGRRFGAVLLASHLVNDPEAGPAFVATAAAHLEPGGVVVGETYPPGWDPADSVGRVTRLGEAHIELLRASVSGDTLDAEVRYGVDDLVWTQTFRARLLGETGLRRLLVDGGLAFDRWLARPGWFLARAPR